MPHTAIDPVVVTAQVILAIQSITKRDTDAASQLFPSRSRTPVAPAMPTVNVEKLKEFQKEMALLGEEVETIIGHAQLLQWLGAVHAARQSFNDSTVWANELPLGVGTAHARKKRQTTLGSLKYGYVIATSLQTLFAYIKQTLGQFTYISSQLLNLYQVLPVEPGSG